LRQQKKYDNALWLSLPSTIIQGSRTNRTDSSLTEDVYSGIQTEEELEGLLTSLGTNDEVDESSVVRNPQEVNVN